MKKINNYTKNCLFLRFLSAVVIAVAILFPVTKSNAAPLKAGLINYTSYAEPLRNTIMQWASSRFDFYIQGPDTRSSDPGSLWSQYLDSCSIYQYNMNALRDWASANSYIFEDILLHSDRDYDLLRSGAGWYWEDKFGIDTATGISSVNEPWLNKGIMKYDGSSFSDVTNAAYDASGVYGSPLTWDQDMYIGYPEPFDQVNVTITIPAVGLGAAWKYWNGTDWNLLILESDGTNSLSVSGQIHFHPPADWQRIGVNGSRNNYFLLWDRSSATTDAISSSIKGDDLRNGTESKARGWKSDDPNIINSGELAYNPTPPTGSSARFRYQARIIGYDRPDRIFVNQPDYQNGHYPWAQYLAYLTDTVIDAGRGYNATMLDNLGPESTIGIMGNGDDSVIAHTDVGVDTREEWVAAMIPWYQELVDIVHAAHPTHKIGGNNRNYASLDGVGDWNLQEPLVLTRWTGARPPQIAGDYPNPDWYLSKPGFLGIMQFTDYEDAILTHDARYSFWDRTNRGPIAALSDYYIGMNDQLYFNYNTLSGNYNHADEVYVWSETLSSLVQDVVADTSTNSKSIYGDFSAFPSGNMTIKIGSSDVVIATKQSDSELTTLSRIVNDHQTGETIKFWRNDTSLIKHQSDGHVYTNENVFIWTSWFPAMGVDLGDPSPRDMNWNGMWRRNFSNAVVIHAPASSATNKVQYDTYSASFDLGGIYYPLRADGTRGSGVTTISLRAGEGAILMRQPEDTTPPVLSGGTPSGTLAAGTNQTDVSFNTNEDATCRYSISANTAYSSMSNNISTVPTKIHSFNVPGLGNGLSYAYYIRCSDSIGNVNNTDYLISFSVGSVVTEDNDFDDSDKKVIRKSKRYISNSKSSVSRGNILIQRGKRFSKNSDVLLYFSKPGGGYYSPMRMKTTSGGSFLVKYRVMKPKGTYKWYAVDMKTGKKSKIKTYKVR